MHYKGMNKTPSDISKELDVAYVLEGSIVLVENQVKVSARLIDAPRNEYLWGQDYERGLSDIMALQGELAQAIAQQIQVELTPQEHDLLSSVHSYNPEANRLYLRGLHFHQSGRPRSLRQAVEYYYAAVALDSTHALAYAHLAESYVFGNYLGMTPEESMPIAEQMAQKALSLNKELPEAYYAIALIQMNYTWNWEKAEYYFERSLNLNPGNASIRGDYSRLLAIKGRLKEAISEAKRVLELDPINFRSVEGLARIYFLNRDFDKAIEYYHNLLELNPDYYQAYLFLGNALGKKGEYDKAFESYAKYSLAFGDTTLTRIIEQTYAVSGPEEVYYQWAEYWKPYSENGPVQPSTIGMHYAQSNDKEQAFQWLEKAYEKRSRGLIMLSTSPLFDNLRSDPRFDDLIERMGLDR